MVKKKIEKKKTWASLKDVCFVSEGLSPLSQVADICFEIFAFVAFCFFKPLYNHQPHRNLLCLQNCREWESLSRLNRSGRNSFKKYLNLCSALSARIKARHVCGSIKPAPACGPVNAAAAAGDVAERRWRNDSRLCPSVCPAPHLCKHVRVNNRIC